MYIFIYSPDVCRFHVFVLRITLCFENVLALDMAALLLYIS